MDTRSKKISHFVILLTASACVVLSSANIDAGGLSNLDPFNRKSIWRKAGRKIDPTNKNSVTRSTLRHLDPTNKNSNTRSALRNLDPTNRNSTVRSTLRHSDVTNRNSNARAALRGVDAVTHIDRGIESAHRRLVKRYINNVTGGMQRTPISFSQGNWYFDVLSAAVDNRGHRIIRTDIASVRWHFNTSLPDQAALTDYDTVYLKGSLPNPVTDYRNAVRMARLMAHELEHVRQYRAMGRDRFYEAYGEQFISGVAKASWNSIASRFRTPKTINARTDEFGMARHGGNNFTSVARAGIPLERQAEHVEIQWYNWYKKFGRLLESQQVLTGSNSSTSRGTLIGVTNATHQPLTLRLSYIATDGQQRTFTKSIPVAPHSTGKWHLASGEAAIKTVRLEATAKMMVGVLGTYPNGEQRSWGLNSSQVVGISRFQIGNTSHKGIPYTTLNFGVSQ